MKNIAPAELISSGEDLKLLRRCASRPLKRRADGLMFGAKAEWLTCGENGGVRRTLGAPCQQELEFLSTLRLLLNDAVVLARCIPF